MFTSLAYVRGFDWLAVFEVLCVRKVSLISNETFIPKWQKRYVIKKNVLCAEVTWNVSLSALI